MTAALEGGEWSEARPGRTLPPGKTRYPFYRRLGGPQGRSGRAENLVPTGIRSRTVQPVAQSLYRVSYPAHISYIIANKNTKFIIDAYFKHNNLLHKIMLKVVSIILCNKLPRLTETYICMNQINTSERLLSKKSTKAIYFIFAHCDIQKH